MHYYIIYMKSKDAYFVQYSQGILSVDKDPLRAAKFFDYPEFAKSDEDYVVKTFQYEIYNTFHV